MKTTEDVIKLCTNINVTDKNRSIGVEKVHEQFKAARERDVMTLIKRLQFNEKALFLLDRSFKDLNCELETITQHTDGSYIWCEQTSEASVAMEIISQDMERIRHQIDNDRLKLERKRASASLVERQVQALQKQDELCVICMERECSIITPCVHLFCSTCIRRHIHNSADCPTCRMPLTEHETIGVTTYGSLCRKGNEIADLILSLPDEPIVLFVQWKTMIRGLRAFFKGFDIRTFALDGNHCQRASTLLEFRNGGVLILCLEDSFAGLHLTHARNVIFAHAIVGDKSDIERMESQAIARCLRHGQTEDVRVYSFIVADCEEERFWRSTHH